MTSPLYGFPELTGTTVERTSTNLNFRYIESLFGSVPTGVNVFTPPTAPTDGSVYLINSGGVGNPTPPTGIWSGKSGQVGVYTSSGWFYTNKHPQYTFGSGDVWTQTSGGSGGGLGSVTLSGIPTAGQIIKATSPTTATWQNESGGTNTVLSLPHQTVDPAATSGNFILFARADGLLYGRKDTGQVYPITLGASVPPIAPITYLLHDTFLGTNGDAVIGRVPDTIGTNTWYQFLGSPGYEIQTNAARSLNAFNTVIRAGYDLGTSNYTQVEMSVLGTGVSGNYYGVVLYTSVSGAGGLNVLQVGNTTQISFNGTNLGTVTRTPAASFEIWKIVRTGLSVDVFIDNVAIFTGITISTIVEKEFYIFANGNVTTDIDFIKVL